MVVSAAAINPKVFGPVRYSNDIIIYEFLDKVIRGIHLLIPSEVHSLNCANEIGFSTQSKCILPT